MTVEQKVMVMNEKWTERIRVFEEWFDDHRELIGDVRPAIDVFLDEIKLEANDKHVKLYWNLLVQLLRDYDKGFCFYCERQI